MAELTTYINRLARSKTRAGITYTVNQNGSVTLTGTSTTGSSYNYFSIPVTLQPGKYKVNGMPETSKTNTYRVDLRANESGGTTYGYGAKEFEVEFTETTTAYYMIRIDGSYKNPLDGVIFYPMIRYADILDDTYEPYQPSVREQIIGTYFPTTQEKGLANNTDLNTITEIGNYVCYTGSSAATMINCPTKTGGFRLIVTNLIVSSNDNSTIRYQWIIPNNLNDVLCFRRRIDMSTDTFSNWYSFKSYQPGLQEQIPYSISVPGKSTSAAISYNGVPTLICLTPNTADSTAGGLYMINSGAVVKLIEKTGVVVAANATSKTFTITNNTSTIMDVCISRCWGR